MSIREGDLRIDVIPNETEVADEQHPARVVRITHIPSGIQVMAVVWDTIAAAKVQALEWLDLELLWAGKERDA